MVGDLACIVFNSGSQIVVLGCKKHNTCLLDSLLLVKVNSLLDILVPVGFPKRHLVCKQIDSNGREYTFAVSSHPVVIDNIHTLLALFQ